MTPFETAAVVTLSEAGAVVAPPEAVAVVTPPEAVAVVTPPEAVAVVTPPEASAVRGCVDRALTVAVPTARTSKVTRIILKYRMKIITRVRVRVSHMHMDRHSSADSRIHRVTAMAVGVVVGTP